MKQKEPISNSKLLFYLIITVLIGLFFIKNTMDFSILKNLQITRKIGLGILGAICMLILRDLGYVLRLRLLTDQKIKFKESVKIILMWEFGSAISPGMIGGKAFAVFLLIKQKINAAKASSIVLLAIILDEFIFVLLFPIFYFIYREKMLSPDTTCPDWILLESKVSFLKNISYLETVIFIMLFVILGFVIIAFLGIFIFPNWIKSLIKRISRWRILKKWHSKIIDFSDDIYATSKRFKEKPKRFWIQLVLFTLMSWSGRYMVGVAIVWGFNIQNFDFLLVYAKQYSLWIMFYLPTTPGSSGLAETLFMSFYCPYFQEGMSGAIAFIWRFLSYYIYLFLGILLLFGGLNSFKNKGK